MLIPLLSNAARAAVFPFLWLQRQHALPHSTWVELRLDGPLSELEAPASRFRSPRAMLLGASSSLRPTTTVAMVRALFTAAVGDRRLGGVLLRIGSLQCGWAVLASLRDEVKRARAAGVRVVAWLPDGATTREYLLASACDGAFATPQATVAPLGVAAGVTFVRGLLARGGIEAEVFARREYKSAAEAFTRDGFSDANRMQMEALLDRIDEGLVSAIAEGRGASRETVRRWIDQGPWRAVDAVREGLLDGVAYDDQLAARLGAPARRVAAGEYMAMVRAMRFRPWMQQQRVGVVEVRGPIVSSGNAALGLVADARRITGALRVARENPKLGAVVLHIDTRGGSALASDVIAREVERLREKKPVVALFSDVAASGGYYVGALAHEIVAQPTTVTGSIGVIAMRFLASRTLGMLGMSHDVIRRGERADFLSPYRAWNESDRAAFDREIDGFYNDFVDVVARGRKRSNDEIEPLARGRVYAGVDAQSVGLVDHLGGLDRALARARELAGGRFDEEPLVVTPPWRMPPPAEATEVRAAVAALAALGVGARGALDLASMVLSSPSEHLFAWDDTLDGL
jgi:protease-4